MNPTLTEIEDLARQAGTILRAGFGQGHQIDYKGIIDPVTEVDRRSEDLIVAEIHNRFPSHQVIAEERGSLSGEAGHVWYIDPLDGTVNYAHGIPIFAVSIAYAEFGTMKFGVVYDPMRDECFSAERGKGSFLNGRPIQVSTTESLDRSLLVTGFPYDIRTNPQNNLNHYTRFALISQGVRRLGSAALDLCYIACSRFDGYWELRLHTWDVAAGGLIVEEAGGVATNIEGGRDYLSAPQSVVTANPALHPQILNVLQNGRVAEMTASF